ncbi:MAG: hypothetical protein NTY98_06760, partial [Verrucomicrobia bacterium]|nr:hypothetical protein [Verrucomicrobiota bacterium]
MHRTCSLLLLFAFVIFSHAEEPAKGKAPAPAPPPVDLDAKARLMQKLNETIIPSVHFENATLEQALEFLRKKSRELDKSSAPAGARGVNIILRQTDFQDSPHITLDLKEVPLSELLRYVTELSLMRYRVESQAVIVTGLHDFEGEMHTRTFKVPPDFLSIEGSEPPDAPADPFAPPAPEPNPSVGKIPRKSVQQILEASGITFPEGSSAIYNPLTSLLKITNTQPNLDLVEAYCESICYHPPKTLAFNLTLIEAPGDLIRQINAEASKTADAGKHLTTLLDLAHKPGSSVRVAGHAFIETKSGSTVTTEAISGPWLSNNVSPDLSSRTSETSDKQPTGLRLKLEPTVGADGQTIDLSLDLKLSPHPFAKKDAPNLSVPHADSTPSEPTADIPNVHLTSSVLFHGNSTKLAGITRPPGLPQKTDATLWAAFITTSVRYVENPPHHLALGTPSTSKSPKGQSSITFQIPQGLFESVMEPTPKPLRDWFIDQGVTFPSGAVIELKADLLQITNTQENIDSISTLIAAAVEKASKTVAVSLHTVRLPSSYLLRLSQAALTSNDQSAEWKELEPAAARGEAVFLESCFFETKSGIRSTHGAARECYFLDQTPPKDKSPPFIAIKGQNLGSFLEIEPTVGADARTIEVDYDHVLHVSAIATDQVPPNDPTQGQNILPPSTSFRALKTHSNSTMHEGEIRLIALHQDISSSHADHIWATFLQCNIVPHFPKPRHALAVTAPAPTNPDSLETRTYHPPPEIIYELRSTTFPPPVAPAMGTDPFGSPQDSSTKMGTDPFGSSPEAFPKRQPTTNEVLEKLGLTFPKGSLSHFDSDTSTLTVRNTPANHALIAVAIEKLLLASPCTVAITTHVLQGPGPLLRRLAAQASRKSDHHSELAELLAAVKAGTVLHLDTARLETKPGTRAT